MLSDSRKILADLIRTRRTASLGTVHDGAPFVSMALFAAEPDFSSFYLYVSRLALHTCNLLRDPRAALMIAETDRDDLDPQTLPRVSMEGRVSEVPLEDAGYERIKALYLARNPQAAFNFELGDFVLFRFQVSAARYVAGFGKIFDLTPDDLARAAKE